MPQQRPKPTPAQIEWARAKMQADPDIARIAKNFSISTEAYIEQVIGFYANPNKQAVVKIMSDDEIRKEGEEPPNMKKIAGIVQGYADAINITNKSKFADPNSQRERVTGAIPVPPAATAEPDEVRNDLKEQVERERTTGKLKKP
jgi:hypothetical protein